LGGTNKVLKNISHPAVEEVDDEESENIEQEEHKQEKPTPLDLLKPEDDNQNRGRRFGAPVILIERFSSKKVVNHLLHGLLN
jgi:CO dehydrogenase/acetyl-CoA synthase beta subunit